MWYTVSSPVFVWMWYDDFDLSASVEKTHFSRQAYNRWMVAYTLIRNPGLRDLTASNMKHEVICAGEKEVE